MQCSVTSQMTNSNCITHSVFGFGSPPLRFWKNFGSPLFFPTPTLKNLSPPPLLYPKFWRDFCAPSNFCPIYRNHCKNTLYYHLSMISTINVQKGCNVWCSRQIFEENYANLSLKSPHFCSFLYLNSA